MSDHTPEPDLPDDLTFEPVAPFVEVGCSCELVEPLHAIRRDDDCERHRDKTDAEWRADCIDLLLNAVGAPRQEPSDG